MITLFCTLDMENYIQIDLNLRILDFDSTELHKLVKEAIKL